MALDIPSLPTESLYKFQAFVGMFLSVGSLVYAFRLIDEAIALIIDLKMEIEILSLEITAFQVPFNENSEELLEEINEDTDAVGGSTAALNYLKDSTDLGRIEKEYAEVKMEAEAVLLKIKQHKELVTEAQKQVLSIRIRSAKITGKKNLIDFKIKKSAYYLYSGR